MRTVLLGTDFMYNAEGKLVPIEINTDVSMDKGCIETEDEIFDLTDLFEFISLNNFTKVVYMGQLRLFKEKLSIWCKENGIEIENHMITGSKTVPYIEDDDKTLIIRSAFDGAAIIDEEYCANKVNFLNLIKSSPFSAQFAYMDENGHLVNNITSIPNYGFNPNFVLKAIYPHYDKNEYPKFFKVKNKEELDVVLKNVDHEFFLMECYFNPDKLYENQIQVVRSYNILIPPDLKNITVGQYRKLTSQKLMDTVEYDSETFELTPIHRKKYLSSERQIGPKLLDTDLVEMADGTFKPALELNVGDLIKTIDIPNPHDSNLSSPCNDFQITYEEFLSGTTYSQNEVTRKEHISSMVDYVTLTFTDGTTWSDTKSSSYLLLRDNNVQFGHLELERPRTRQPVYDCKLKIGDQLILLDAGQDILTSVLKTVSKIKREKKIFEGWEITVAEEHLFLTKAEDSDSSYVAIEHNVACAYKLCCSAGCGGCLKTFVCCWGTCSPFFSCASCV